MKSFLHFLLFQFLRLKIRLILFVKKVSKINQGGQTRSPVQQNSLCIHDAQTVTRFAIQGKVSPLKTQFCTS